MTPEWLPPQLSLAGASLNADLDTLYAVFKDDFIDAPASVVDSSPVYVNTHPDRSRWEGKYTHGFTHMITRGKKERSIDYSRARKLPWVKAILENYTQPEVTSFWHTTPEGDSLFLWLVELDFVVIIRPKDSRRIMKSQKRVIITAYHIDEAWLKRDLQKKYGKSFRQL